MKKNFFRVKQIVDQTVAGAEQSEAFNEDVQAAEKQVELLKQACGTTSKKIASLLSKSEGNHEKRLRKITDSAIGNTMIECSAALGDKSIFKEMIVDCGSLGTKLGWEMLAHEVELEKTVVEPLMIVDNEANNIAKARKNLSKLILDMDSARSRYRNAQKTAGSAGNISKINLIKEELEDAVLKVDQNRDALAADIYTLLSREAEFAKLILTFAESQRRYHEAALKVLDEFIPNLEAKWQASAQKPVFGCSLDEHLRTSGRTIAHPIEVCVITLHETGMEEEGVFRIAGGASKVRKFRAALDANVADLGFALELRDVHTVAGILKSYLRELPDPMLCSSLYDDWINAIKIAELDARLKALAEVIRKLPDGRWQNTRYLMRFFYELSKKHEINKMTPQNLAIVLAPCLIWSPTTNEALALNMSMANMHSAIVEHLITFAENLFPGEMEYYATYSKSLYASMLLPPSPLNGGFTDRDEADSKEVILRKTHTRIGSNEGIADQRINVHSSLIDNTIAGSPRPIIRKKNKPAPAVPEPPNLTASTVSTTTTPSKPAPVPVKTPDKEERKLVEDSKPSLPPTGPDAKRISALPAASAFDKPKLAPRPSLNPSHLASANPPHPIGFEAIESELRRHGSVKQVLRERNAGSKRVSEGPLAHPNAVNVFGALPAPGPVPDARRSDVDKPKPQVPERPSLAKIQVLPSTIMENATMDNKVVEQSIIAKKTTSKLMSSPPSALNASEHPDIEFADSDEKPHQIERPRPPKPERPEKPERMSHPIESNNNTSNGDDKKEGQQQQQQHSPMNVVVPKPAPRSSLPKPRDEAADDCTDF